MIYVEPPKNYRQLKRHLDEQHNYSPEWTGAAGEGRLTRSHEENHATEHLAHKHCEHRWSAWSYVMSPAGTRTCTLCGTVEHD